MMKSRIGCIFLVMLSLTVMSCGNKRYDPDFPAIKKLPYFDSGNPYGAGRLKTRYIAEKLAENLKDTEVREKKIAILPYYNLEALDQTTPFGLYMGEQLISEMSELGFNVIEIRNDQSIYMAQKIGENFILRGNSHNNQTLRQLEIRKLKEIFGQDLVGLVCGTYFKRGKVKDKEKADDLYYINARIVRIPDSLVLSTASTELAVPIQLSSVEHYNDNSENKIPRIGITTVNLTE